MTKNSYWNLVNIPIFPILTEVQQAVLSNLKYGEIFVTRFAKRGLPHTSNLLILMTHNFRLERVIDLKFGQ